MQKSLASFYLKLSGLCLIVLLALGSGAVGSAQAVTSNPELESIDFKNNIQVTIDHRNNTKGESPIGIKEYGEANEVEWQVSSAQGKTKKWPVVYVKQSTIKLVAQFSVNAETRALLERGLEGDVTFTGESTIGGTAISFRKELTLEEIRTQLTAHQQYITTGEITASAALPNKVIYELITIRWKWMGKERGTAFEREIGKSTHNLYLTYAQPRAASSVTDYLTLLDLDTQGIEKEGSQPPSEAQVISGILKQFKTLSIGVRWYEIESGTLHRGGFTLEYYQNENTTGQTLEQIVERGFGSCPIEAVKELISKGQGKCGAWARIFSFALAIEGIPSAVVTVESNVSRYLLVKNWEFTGGTGGRFKAQEIKDLSGVPAQGVQNPPAAFNLHFIVEAPLGSNKLYDPSYGTGPFEGAERIKKYQNESIAGFCESGTEIICTKATVGAEELKTSILEKYE